MLKQVSLLWEQNKEILRTRFTRKDEWFNYEDLVKMIVQSILNEPKDIWDFTHITEIDDGHYQGTLLYLIPLNTYQPGANDYLITAVEYGSCTVCDTLQAAHNQVGEDRVNALMTLSLHICQHIKKPYSGGWHSEYDEVMEGEL